MDHLHNRRHEGVQGFALILALLTLVLLTFLGLTLATSTSTELQIATNFRWSQQAYYNAEAGLEAGRAILRTANWNGILPAPRTTPWNVDCTFTDGVRTCTLSNPQTPPTPPSGADQWANPLRQLEGASCDVTGSRMGYGFVLNDGGANAPYQYKSTIYGQPIHGAFTLWVRRPLEDVTPAHSNEHDPSSYKDSEDNELLILTSEGVAPFEGQNVASNAALAAQSVRVVEATVSLVIPEAETCGRYSGQAGQGSEGAGFGGCTVLEGVTTGITSAGGTVGGTGAAITDAR